MKCLNSDHAAIQCQAFKASLSASVKMLKVSSTLMSASRMGFFPLTVLLPKQHFRVTHTKLLYFGFAAMSAPPLSLTVFNLLPYIPLNILCL